MLKKLNKITCQLLLLITFLLYDIKVAAAVQLQDLDVKKFHEVMHDKRPITIFFLFTSWCKVCKDSLPEVLGLEQKYSEDKFKVIILSLDKNVENLKTISKSYQDQNNKIYYFGQQTIRQDISTAFLKNGIKYCGTIPHVTIFYKGKVIADDNYEIQSVKNFVHHLYEQKEATKQ